MVKINLVFILTVLLVMSCYIDVPHDGKFDLQNPFGTATLTVNVSDNANAAIKGTLVKINNDYEKLSDDSGKCVFANVQNGSLSIQLSKTGYRDIVIDTQIQTGTPIHIEVILNYIPSIKESYAFSSVKKIKDPLDSIEYTANYICNFIDLDGITDIDSVVLELIGEKFKMNLTESDSLILSTYCFTEKESPVNLYDLQGENGEVTIYDKSGEIVKSNGVNLVRFVENIPQILKPEDGTIFMLPDTVKWTAFSDLYESYIQLEIKRTEESIYMRDSIDIRESKYYLDTLFAESQYEIFIRIYDMFGNYAESANIFSVY